ncbi:carbohydrate ABC transporter permease [Lachnospiraceae bacterium 29-91]
MNKLRINKLTMIIFYIVLTVIAIIQVYPFFWVITSSFKTAEQLASTPAYSLPQQLFMGNYERAMQSNLPRYFLNSIVVAVCVLAALVIISAPVAFALSKLRFRQSEKVMSFFLFGMMIPVFSCLIPMFRVYNALGIRNTYWALIIPQVGFGLPMCIYLYKNFMERIPNSLVEAAEIDGASPWYVFTKIIFPMSKNVTVTIITFNFIYIWNEFVYANTFMTKNIMKTLPIGLNDFIGEMGMVDWGSTFAAITLTIIPTLIVYFILNRQVIDGMTSGAVK